jgi:acetyl-CoA C-acetyltransferase
MVSHSTPIIVGVGQVCARHTDPASPCSPVSLAVAAAQKACDDAAGSKPIQAYLDAVVGIRLFSDMGGPWPSPFGRAQNYPRAIASQLGADPAYAAYSHGSGDTPQKLLAQWCDKIHRQEARAVLLVGSEATATQRAMQRAGATLDWSDNTDGQLDDHGVGAEGMLTPLEAQHGLMLPITIYALLENARRARLNQDPASYAREMGELFAPFSQVAANNPYAMFPQAYTADQLINPSADNPLLATPYTKGLVAKDGVDQAAAVVLTSVGLAKELGIPEHQWVYLHGEAHAADRPCSERADMGQSEAMANAYKAALQRAGVSAKQVDFLDLYSCFPIAVSTACECLGIGQDDPRGLTLTGGLPFFGGPGNNYTMHAIVSMIETLRSNPDSLGLVGANGGLLTKHSVAIYSCRPPEHPWQEQDSSELQQQLDQRPKVAFDPHPNGNARIETYTVSYHKGVPTQGIVIGRMADTNKRFIATTIAGDSDTLSELVATDPLGRSCQVVATQDGNRVAFDAAKLKAL